MSIHLKLHVAAQDSEYATQALESAAQAVKCFGPHSSNMILASADNRPIAEVEMDAYETESGLTVIYFGEVAFHQNI